MRTRTWQLASTAADWVELTIQLKRNGNGHLLLTARDGHNETPLSIPINGVEEVGHALARLTGSIEQGQAAGFFHRQRVLGGYMHLNQLWLEPSESRIKLSTQYFASTVQGRSTGWQTLSRNRIPVQGSFSREAYAAMVHEMIDFYFSPEPGTGLAD